MRVRSDGSKIKKKKPRKKKKWMIAYVPGAIAFDLKDWRNGNADKFEMTMFLSSTPLLKWQKVKKMKKT